MSVGVEVLDSTGRVVMSSGSEGGVFLEALVLVAGNSGSKVYNTDARYSSRTALVIQFEDGTHTWTTGASGGYPSLTWTSYAPTNGNPTQPTTLHVFAQ